MCETEVVGSRNGKRRATHAMVASLCRAWGRTRGRLTRTTVSFDELRLNRRHDGRCGGVRRSGKRVETASPPRGRSPCLLIAANPSIAFCQLLESCPNGRTHARALLSTADAPGGPAPRARRPRRTLENTTSRHSSNHSSFRPKKMPWPQVSTLSVTMKYDTVPETLELPSRVHSDNIEGFRPQPRMKYDNTTCKAS